MVPEKTGLSALSLLYDHAVLDPNNLEIVCPGLQEDLPQQDNDDAVNETVET